MQNGWDEVTDIVARSVDPPCSFPAALAAHEQIEFAHKWMAPEHIAERKSSPSRATPRMRELLARNRLRATSRPVLRWGGLGIAVIAPAIIETKLVPVESCAA
jgi:hypothetical protein